MDVSKKLKEKVIRNYEYFINRLNLGYKEDYSEILELITLIELGIKINNYEFISQYYLNNGKL